MEVSGQFHVPSRASGICYLEGWVGLSLGVDPVKKVKSLVPAWNQNQIPPFLRL
jgi:hypothetical protein